MSLPVSVVDSLCTEIRKMILHGKYPPGTVLRQEEIASQFEVSRVPLREAFSRLEAEGYLRLRPRRGYSVASLNPEEIAEIFDLRMVVESHAGQIATLNRTAQDVKEVKAIAASMEGLDPASPDYHMRWCDLNRDFHERIIQCCHRPRLLKIALQLRDQVEPYVRLESSMTGDSSEPDLDHREMLKAFEQGNAELMGALSAAHCGRTANRLLDSLRNAQRDKEKV